MGGRRLLRRRRRRCSLDDPEEVLVVVSWSGADLGGSTSGRIYINGRKYWG